MDEQSRRAHVRPAATERQRNRYCSIRRNDACNARVHHKGENYLTTLIKKKEGGGGGDSENTAIRSTIMLPAV